MMCSDMELGKGMCVQMCYIACDYCSMSKAVMYAFTNLDPEHNLK